MRRRALAARLDELGVDALFITRLLHTRYLTGFTGSNGQVLIRRDGALFLTDGRYTEQSRREVPDLERHTYTNPLREELPGLLDGSKLCTHSPDHSNRRRPRELPASRHGVAEESPRCSRH